MTTKNNHLAFFTELQELLKKHCVFISWEEFHLLFEFYGDTACEYSIDIDFRENTNLNKVYLSWEGATAKK